MNFNSYLAPYTKIKIGRRLNVNTKIITLVEKASAIYGLYAGHLFFINKVLLEKETKEVTATTFSQYRVLGNRYTILPKVTQKLIKLYETMIFRL